MTDSIPYIAVFPTYNDAYIGAREFIREHNTVVKVDKRGSRFTIKLRDGNEYIFMSSEVYYKWHFGQVYRYIGKEELWHSDQLLKAKKDE